MHLCAIKIGCCWQLAQPACLQCWLFVVCGLWHSRTSSRTLVPTSLPYNWSLCRQFGQPCNGMAGVCWMLHACQRQACPSVCHCDCTNWFLNHMPARNPFLYGYCMIACAHAPSTVQEIPYSAWRRWLRVCSPCISFLNRCSDHLALPLAAWATVCKPSSRLRRVFTYQPFVFFSLLLMDWRSFIRPKSSDFWHAGGNYIVLSHHISKRTFWPKIGWLIASVSVVEERMNDRKHATLWQGKRVMNQTQ